MFNYPLGYANSNEVFPLYIGDDRTDEDAFKVSHALHCKLTISLAETKIFTYNNEGVITDCMQIMIRF